MSKTRGQSNGQQALHELTPERFIPVTPEGVMAYIEADRVSQGYPFNLLERTLTIEAMREYPRKIVLGALSTLAMNRCEPEQVTHFLGKKLSANHNKVSGLEQIALIGDTIFAAFARLDCVDSGLVGVSNRAHMRIAQLYEMTSAKDFRKRQGDEELSNRARLLGVAYKVPLGGLVEALEDYSNNCVAPYAKPDVYVDSKGLAQAAINLNGGTNSDLFLFREYERTMDSVQGTAYAELRAIQEQEELNARHVLAMSGGQFERSTELVTQ